MFSAPYPGPGADEPGAAIFHEWNLDQPCDILQVYLLLRNLDAWTAGRFRERVEDGVMALVEAVVHGGQLYSPWKRQDDVLLVRENLKNVPPEPMASVFPTPPPAQKRAGGGKNQTRRYQQGR